MNPALAVIAALFFSLALMVFGPKSEFLERPAGSEPGSPLARFLRAAWFVVADRVVYGPVIGVMLLWLGAATGLVAPLPDGSHVADAAVARGAFRNAHLAVLVVSYGVMSVSLDRSGFMKWCAYRAVSWAGGDVRRAFFATFAVCSVITLFTSNDIVVVAMTPILLHIGMMAGLTNMVPFLVGMFVAANTSAMGVLVGSPTNLVMASAANLAFVSYSRLMFIPAVVATVAAALTVWGLSCVRGLPGAGLPARYTLESITEERVDFTSAARVRAGIFGFVLVGMMTFDLFGLPVGRVWMLAVAGAIVMFLLDVLPAETRAEALLATLRRAPWTVPPFLISLFFLVEALGRTRMLDHVKTFLASHVASSPLVFTLEYGLGAMTLVNVVNDIPSSIIWGMIYPGLQTSLGAAHGTLALGAILIGVNTGCYLTIIGSLAGLMWRQILRTSPVGRTLSLPNGWHLLLFGGSAAITATIAACIALWLQEMILPFAR